VAYPLKAVELLKREEEEGNEKEKEKRGRKNLWFLVGGSCGC